MKLLVCVLTLVGVSVSVEAAHLNEDMQRILKGCDFAKGYYINGFGMCTEPCPEGTSGYSSGCGPLTPEATCEEPKPKTDHRGGSLCDYEACYCNSPTVRDTVSGRCVTLDKCPKKLNKALV